MPGTQNSKPRNPKTQEELLWQNLSAEFRFGDSLPFQP